MKSLARDPFLVPRGCFRRFLETGLSFLMNWRDMVRSFVGLLRGMNSLG